MPLGILWVFGGAAIVRASEARLVEVCDQAGLSVTYLLHNSAGRVPETLPLRWVHPLGEWAMRTVDNMLWPLAVVHRLRLVSAAVRWVLDDEPRMACGAPVLDVPGLAECECRDRHDGLVYDFDDYWPGSTPEA